MTRESAIAALTAGSRRISEIIAAIEAEPTDARRISGEADAWKAIAAAYERGLRELSDPRTPDTAVESIFAAALDGFESAVAAQISRYARILACSGDTILSAQRRKH